MSRLTFRFVRKEDATYLSAIYAYYVKETPISFEYTPPSETEFATRIETIGSRYPYLVCEADGVPVGYAYASEFKPRVAYQWDIETSIYIHREYHRMHIASTFYELLFRILEMQGYCKAYALITTPNESSETFHKTQGFETVGIFRKTGYKLGQWRDVVFMEKEIAPAESVPIAPIGINQLNRQTLEQMLEQFAVIQ
ncbi:MAG: N-acetyltransferase family protein [Anaerofustis sp.]|jgi:phosphinothricin acetyltransferase